VGGRDSKEEVTDTATLMCAVRSDVSSSFTFLKRRSCADKASSNACAPTERAREEDEEQEGRLELQHAEPERKP